MANRVMEVSQAKYLISPVRFEGMQRCETSEIPKESMRKILYNPKSVIRISQCSKAVRNPLVFPI